MKQLFTFLPNARRIRVQVVEIDEATQRLTFHVAPTHQTAPCPRCGVRSRRVHSHYRRTLADLPWAAYSVQLHLQVRRFYCHNRRCSQHIFCERLPEIVLPHQRRTDRLAMCLVRIGLTAGGTAGARLSRALGYGVSRQTVLRALQQRPMPPCPTPRVVGVDDWAPCKHQRYGTIVVDLERRRPVALLPDRTADTLAQWLRTHPGVHILCRDRAGMYADGARTGAPHAQQVADRFPLLRNLAEAVEQVFHQHRTVLKALHVPSAGLPLATSAAQPAVPGSRASLRRGYSRR